MSIASVAVQCFSSGTQQRGPGPLCGSTVGTGRFLSANLDEHTFHCFKCGRCGNALDLWTQATRQTPYDAAIDLCDRLGIALPTLQPPIRNSEEEPVAPQPEASTMNAP